MASTARVFFAGIGTTFLIIGAGFGGGIMFAKSALHNTPPAQTRAASHAFDPVRVVLPTTAEAAEAPQQAPAPVQAAVETKAATPDVAVPEKQIEKVEVKKPNSDERARKKRYAERKARRAMRQMEARQTEPRSAEPRIMAFDSDEPARPGLFGIR